MLSNLRGKVKKLILPEKAIVKEWCETSATTSSLAEKYNVSQATIARLIRAKIKPEVLQVFLKAKRENKKFRPL
jgi:predicted transcriptional regulator